MAQESVKFPHCRPPQLNRPAPTPEEIAESERLCLEEKSRWNSTKRFVSFDPIPAVPALPEDAEEQDRLIAEQEKLLEMFAENERRENGNS